VHLTFINGKEVAVFEKLKSLIRRL